MMEHDKLSSSIPQKKMLKIIEAQTEITKIGMNLGMVMAIASEKAQQLLNASGAVIELAEGDEMVYRASSGLLKPYLGLRLSRHNSLSGLCVSKGEILYSPNSLEDERADRAACKRVGIKSMLLIPLKHENDCVGVLKVASDKPDFFSETDTYILSMISEMVAALMFHAIQLSTDELYLRATRDPLTGLGNRAKFYDVLRQQLSFSERHSEKMGVIMIDMDGLKQTNDSLGHLAGDAIIKEFGKRVKKSTRKNDTTARLGGDEFAIIVPNIENTGEIEAIINRLFENLKEPLIREERKLKLEASIGFAMYPDDAKETTELVEIADRRMYKQKQTKKQNQSN